MRINAARFLIEPGFYLVLAAAILFIPIRWVAAWLLAAILHELGHFTAVRICGHRVFSVKIGFRGAKMYTDPLLNSEWLCALAGPVVGLGLLVFVRWIPRVAFCGMLQAIFNLLPVEGMDGGRALSGLLRLVLPEKIANKVSCTLSVITVGVLLIGWIFFFT